MMCYRDTTFCVSPECENKCGRKLTPEIEEMAKKSGMLLATAYFCGIVRSGGFDAPSNRPFPFVD